MFCWHKWSVWGKKEYSYARTYYYQHKTCEKCGKVKERMI